MEVSPCCLRQMARLRHTQRERRRGLRDGAIEGRLAAPVGRPTASVLDQLDWFTFHCSACGEETFVGRSHDQSVDDFWLMCEWLYGDPPICSPCLSES